MEAQVFYMSLFPAYDTKYHLLYPYFFLDVETQGVAGVVKWIILLAIAFVTMSYILFGVDRIRGKKD